MTSLHDKAMRDLQHIRAAMDGATRFTGVSGWGEMLMGATALGAAAIAQRQPSEDRWLAVWLLEALLAAAIGVGAMVMKSRRLRRSLLAQPARKLALGLAPALVAAAALTVLFVRLELIAWLPGLWLLLYGIAVVGGGAFSVPTVPAMGAAFMVVGVAAMLAGPELGNLFLAVGFGGLNLLFGAVIWRRHGG
ncbi:MAG: hypothetical protein ACRD2Z_09935 [Thermoanaerobaculia bacterium]